MKIIATIGPACSDPETLKGMVRAGLNNVRINTAHIEKGYITKIRKMVDQVNEETKASVGIMVDLKGPELRTRAYDGGRMEIKAGNTYRFSDDESDPRNIGVNYLNVIDTLEPGDLILVSDGKITLRVVQKSGNTVEVKALDSGVIRDRGRINIPGKVLNLGVTTERDELFIKEGIEAGVEFFALSFVQTRENVEELQELVMSQGGDQLIVSKIETKSGLQNISDISRVSDFIMVARGDLGVEMPLEEVIVAQKQIIRESHKHGVPTIVATQVLESMVSNPVPTRAEVSDVTNAILDNADVLMLSEETAIGKYPVESVEYLKNISEYVERSYGNFAGPEEFLGNRIAYSIAMAARVVASEIRAAGILAFTQSGNTAKMLSAVRPPCPVYAVTTNPKMPARLSLYRDVIPLYIPQEEGQKLTQLNALEWLLEKGMFEKGSRLVITSGAPYFLFGGTNEVRIATVGRFIGRGYPCGKSTDGVVTRNIDGTGDVLITDSLSERDMDRYGKFRCVVCTSSVPHRLLRELTSRGVTVLSNTRLAGDVKEGDHVTVDGDTGVING
ncbi:pyruvate kinase [Thermogymnomonas acidicola]|uniref:Pyruvate kinase n=2 Tax=Thermogymnomonas acidicola TaxID=399579 RepID=A0AA37BR64_9ARCH|nr:pyruvate kinase [Thermogymnomonas acidicola]